MSDHIPNQRPCPFCGKPAELVIDSDHHGLFYTLGCSDASCIGHFALYTVDVAETPIADGVRQWNRRASDDAADESEDGQ